MAFLTQLDTVGPFVIGAGIGAVACAIPYIRRGYHKWRLARRLRQDAYMQADELREYELAIGEELPPVDPGRLAGAVLLTGVALAIPFWFAGTFVETLWEHEWLIVTGVGGLYLVWRWLNDPREMRAEAGISEIELPSEAVAGFLGALCVVVLILLAVAALF